MRTVRRFLGREARRPAPARRCGVGRHLVFQPLERRELLAAIGDWAMLDLRSYFSNAGADLLDLSGVAFHGGQLAVAANVGVSGQDDQARLVLVDVDLDAHAAGVGNQLVIPSLGGASQVKAVNSDGSTVYLTGFSVSPLAPSYGEAYRATWDGVELQNVGLGYIGGRSTQDPIARSQGMAVTPSGVVAGESDAGRAVFECDDVMVHAGDVDGAGVILGISDDRVKVGINNDGVIWEADNQTRRTVEDPAGYGTLLFAISPDHSRLLGSSNVLEGSSGSPEKLTWWTYEGVATLVEDAEGQLVEGRFTGGTNADVGYHVAQAPSTSPGDLLYIESANQTLRIADWFHALSGVDLPAETSDSGPRIDYDYERGQVAIVSGGYLLTVKIWDDNQPPVAVADAYTTPVNTVLDVVVPGVLGNDTDDGATLQAVLVDGPRFGTLELRDDGSFTYTPQAGFNREDSFTYRAHDGDYASPVVTVAVTLDTAYPWHNGRLARDVNDDGAVTPIDALQIINRINALGTGPLGTRPHPYAAPFYDTARDKFITPIDALFVINYLNGDGVIQGEGESSDLGDVASVPATPQSTCEHPVPAESHERQAHEPVAALPDPMAWGGAALGTWPAVDSLHGGSMWQELVRERQEPRRWRMDLEQWLADIFGEVTGSD